MPLPFRKLRYIWNYEGQIRELINVMKYKPSLRTATYMANRMANIFPALFQQSNNWDLVIPIPSSKQTRYSRGFNQCISLARGLKRIKQLNQTTLTLTALEHMGCQFVQASLPRGKRVSNVRNSFLAHRELVNGQNILLVDDVITSGATSAAAAIELYKKGAKSVDLVALARATSWQENRLEIFRALCKGKGFSKRGKYERISEISRHSKKTKRPRRRLPLGYQTNS